MSDTFKQTSVSPSGAPDIEYSFQGDTVRAELCGAKLYCELLHDGDIDMRITDATGEILADLIVKHRSHRNETENVMDIGSALLWSHWRYIEAQKGQDNG